MHKSCIRQTCAWTWTIQYTQSMYKMYRPWHRIDSKWITTTHKHRPYLLCLLFPSTATATFTQTHTYSIAAAKIQKKTSEHGSGERDRERKKKFSAQLHNITMQLYYYYSLFIFTRCSIVRVASSIHLLAISFERKYARLSGFISLSLVIVVFFSCIVYNGTARLASDNISNSMNSVRYKWHCMFVENVEWATVIQFFFSFSSYSFSLTHTTLNSSHIYEIKHEG